MKKLETVLKVVGWVVLVAGVVLGYADLQGSLRYTDREAFVQWATELNSGLPMDTPAAQAFSKRFPPPDGEAIEGLTHVTKWKTQLDGGPILDASFNYMRRDQSRTRYVATLSDVREWATESRYPWLSWLLTTVGAVVVLVSEAIEWGGDRKAEKRVPSDAQAKQA